MGKLQTFLGISKSAGALRETGGWGIGFLPADAKVKMRDQRATTPQEPVVTRPAPMVPRDSERQGAEAGQPSTPGTGPAKDRVSNSAGVKGRDSVSSSTALPSACHAKPAPRQTATQTLFRLVGSQAADPVERAKQVEQVDALLHRNPGLNLNRRDKHGYTPLMRALAKQNPEIAQTLISHGAGGGGHTRDGRTALHLVAGLEDGSLIHAMGHHLVKNGADVNKANKDGLTPLCVAKTDQAVHFLQIAGAEKNHRDARGNTPLMHAALRGNEAVMVGLIDRGADISSANRNGATLKDLLRTHYGLPGHAELPDDPAQLGNFIDDKQADAQRPAVTERVSMPLLQPATTGRATPINKLPSGPKIALVKEQYTNLNELNKENLDALSRALGFGSSAEDTDAARLPKKRAVSEVLHEVRQDFQRDFSDYRAQNLLQSGKLTGLSEAEKKELAEVMDLTHMAVGFELDSNGAFKPGLMKVYFNGTQSERDMEHNLQSAFGETSEIAGAARRVGQLLAKQLEHPGNELQLDRVSGFSMGGASAQTFLAALQSHTQLPKQPSMVLFDPQLLNNLQAAEAVKGGKYAVDFTAPRGVAITLDYDKAPHRGLMNVMKGFGRYKSPGLVQLRLGLTHEDGYDNEKPKTSGPRGLGYHLDMRQYDQALGRFIGQIRPPQSGGSS